MKKAKLYTPSGCDFWTEGVKVSFGGYLTDGIASPADQGQGAWFITMVAANVSRRKEDLEVIRATRGDAD